jgi:hypothetical protein
MYGMVNRAMEEMVCAAHGVDTWERIKARAGVDIEVFITNDPYDDSVTYQLVGAAAEVTQTPAEEILFAFGEHWVLHTAQRGYGAMLDASGRTLREFLTNLPRFHTRVAMIFPALQPPRFTCTDAGEDAVMLRYETHREGLAPFVRGLLSGLARRLHTTAHVTHVTQRADAGYDEFLIRWTAETP